MCLCRSWGTGWWTSCVRSTRRRLSSRLSPCPRSLWTGSHSAPCVVIDGELNSWWKCRRSSSYSSLQQRTAKQTVDIPVPLGRGGRVGHGGLQGFSQGQSSTAFHGADHVDTPVSSGSWRSWRSSRLPPEFFWRFILALAWCLG